MYTMNKQKIKESVEKSIQLYNKYRSPEAIAQLIELSDEEIKIKLSGTYCVTCGLYDWIEDLEYVLEDNGIRTEIYKIIEPRGYYGDRVIVFKVKKK